jgi:hypothetical protein
MDKDGPKMLTLEMIKGTQDGLKDMNSILLSKLQQKLFSVTRSRLAKS